PILSIGGAQQFMIANPGALHGPSQRWPAKLELMISAIARLWIAELNLPVRPGILRVQDYAALHNAPAACNPTLLRADEKHRPQFYVFFYVDRLPDCFELRLSPFRSSGLDGRPCGLFCRLLRGRTKRQGYRYQWYVEAREE